MSKDVPWKGKTVYTGMSKTPVEGPVWPCSISAGSFSPAAAVSVMCARQHRRRIGQVRPAAAGAVRIRLGADLLAAPASDLVLDL